MNVADRWQLMALVLAGESLPPLPAIVGRVHGCDGLGIRADALLVLTFGKESDDGGVRPVRGAASVSLRKLLDDP